MKEDIVEEALSIKEKARKIKEKALNTKVFQKAKGVRNGIPFELRLIWEEFPEGFFVEFEIVADDALDYVHSCEYFCTKFFATRYFNKMVKKHNAEVIE